MSSEDESILRDIRTSFVKDGLSWSLDPEQKLIHLWKKNSQTELELQKISNEVRQLRQRMKDEMASVQNNFAKVRELSSEKEHVIAEENAKLHGELHDLTIRYEALLEERTELEQLYTRESGQLGICESNPFRYFLEERADLVMEASKSKEDLKQVSTELTETKLQYDESESMVCSLQEQLAQSLVNLEVEKSKMDTIRADHQKQHKLHRKQIHDLREKLSDLEVTKNPKGSEDSNTMSSHLQEALSEVSLLSSELDRSTCVAEETDRLNQLLSDELSKANMEKDKLSLRIGELTQEMAEEREKSIEVLEEQLERQHELESFLESTQLEVNAQKRTVQMLTDELAREQETTEKLQAKVQDLEEKLHKRNSAALEKELMQQTLKEHERTIEIIESERNTLQHGNQDLTTKCHILERKIREQLSTMEELSKELSEVLSEKEMHGKEKAELKEKLASIEEENHQLMLSVTNTRSKMESLSAESLTQSKQSKEQGKVMESQLISLQNEKHELLKELEDETSQHERTKESISMAVTQLQDELHSKNQELTRSRMETQQALQDISQLKQNLDKEVVVKREADLRLDTLQLKNKTLLQEIQDLQHEKEALVKQLVLEKEHRNNQRSATQKLAAAEKEALNEEKKLEISMLKTEWESAIREKEKVVTNLSAKLEATIEVYEKRLKTMQAVTDNTQEKLMEVQLDSETKAAAAQMAEERHKEDKDEKVALEEKLHIMQEQFDNATIQFSALKDKWYDEKLEFEKQLLQKQQKFESTFTKANVEKEKLYSQMSSLQEQKVALDRELSDIKASLESVQGTCKALRISRSEKEKELEATEGLLEKTRMDLEEMSNNVLEKEEKINALIASCDSSKQESECREKELKLVQTYNEDLKSTLQEKQNGIDMKDQEIEQLKVELSGKSATITELQSALEEMEKKLQDTVSQLMEVDALWLRTQNELENEKAEKYKLEHESRMAQRSRSKDQKETSMLLQEKTNLKNMIKEMRQENGKLLSASRRSESRLAKKIKELDSVHCEVKKLGSKISQLEQESTSAKEQLLLQNSSTSMMSDSLLEELREERLKVLLKEEAVSNLEKKMERMSVSVTEMERVLKQKEEDIYHTEVTAREQKIKAQAMSEKMEEIANEKEMLKSTIFLLKEECVSQNHTISKLQTKLESCKAKYVIKRRHSKDKLASTWSDFTQKKQELEYSLDGAKNKLSEVQKKLNMEYEWRNTSDELHQKTLQEKSHLLTKLGVIEKELGEKDHEVCELELKLERMQQENVMLEERNKMLVVHIQSSGTSLQEQEPQRMLQKMSSSGGGISLRTTPISPSHHFHHPINSRLTISSFTFSKSAPLHHSTPNCLSTSSLSPSSSTTSFPLPPTPLVNNKADVNRAGNTNN